VLLWNNSDVVDWVVVVVVTTRWFGVMSVELGRQDIFSLFGGVVVVVVLLLLGLGSGNGSLRFTHWTVVVVAATTSSLVVTVSTLILLLMSIGDPFLRTGKLPLADDEVVGFLVT